MRAFLVLTSLVVVAGSCQRLDDGEPLQPTSLGEDGSGGDDDEGGTTFLPQNDSDDTAGADDGTSQGCNPVTQTGCEMGEKCTAMAGGASPVFICVGAGGSNLQPFDPCQPMPTTGLDACSAGTVCVGTGDSGLCLPLCSADSDCDQGTCSADPVYAIPYCADDCLPFESQCEPPMACRRNGERFSCGFLLEDDVGGAGADCDTTDDTGCAAGFACITGTLVPGCTSPGCCASLCDTSGADPCSAPATCNSVLTAPAPGFESIGACFVPA